jgi:hypothetical protein
MSDTTSYLHWLDVDWIKENSTINDNQGLPFTDRFVCLLNAPGGELKKNGWLELQVMSVELPNFGIDPTEQELNGAKRFYFKGRSDSELSITFMETPDLLLRRFFYAWLQKAIDINETSGVRRSYMNEYMPSPSEFIIFPLNYKGTASYADRFVNIFPYDISGISYNYGQAGELLKTTVKFKYMYHYMTSIKDSKPYHISESASGFKAAN